MILSGMGHVTDLILRDYKVEILGDRQEELRLSFSKEPQGEITEVLVIQSTEIVRGTLDIKVFVK